MEDLIPQNLNQDILELDEQLKKLKDENKRLEEEKKKQQILKIKHQEVRELVLANMRLTREIQQLDEENAQYRLKTQELIDAHARGESLSFILLKAQQDGNYLQDEQVCEFFELPETYRRMP